MRVIGVIGILLFSALIGAQIYSSFTRRNEVRQELQSMEKELQKAESDEAKLKSDLRYYSQPANLEKAIRERFNYRKPGEKLIITVPYAGSSTATSTNP
ncbi:MAG: septum formation initiator family protein [Patescibacteria group bacterium]